MWVLVLNECRQREEVTKPSRRWTREDWYYEINLALDVNVWFILKVTEIVETNFFPTNAYAKEGFYQSNYKINI